MRTHRPRPVPRPQPSGVPHAEPFWYLLMRGDDPTALHWAHTWHTRWRKTDGLDNPDVLSAANLLSHAHYRLGHVRRRTTWPRTP